MKNISIILFIILMSVSIKSQTLPVTVRNVDLNRYTGLWYEIAKIPNSFQDQCLKNTTAEYYLNEDGSIKIINSCTEDDGSRDEAEGLGKIVDERTKAKLEVSFVSFLGIRPFWGDYWIIGLGDEYEYAVIGSPGFKYGWILSRDKKLGVEKLNEAFAILKKNGYDIKKFVMTIQD